MSTKKQPSGEWRVISRDGDEVARAFIPGNLPPPDFRMTKEILAELELASSALGRLDGMTSVLPEPEIFLRMYLQKEALLSSQIEGTQSTFTDFLMFELEGAHENRAADTLEVSNYVQAITLGVERVRTTLPISTRLLKELHAILLKTGRGSEKNPGEYRRNQNWIGGDRPGNALFVPPPHTHVDEAMSNLETFIHSGDFPVLVRAALAHVQFETIHPFLDGNGRIGRLLLILMLCSEGILRKPVLYLSLYLKQHRDRYYALLKKVREESAWEEWVLFFLTAVHDTSDAAARTASRIIELFERDRASLREKVRIGGTIMNMLHLLQRRPLVNAAVAKEELGISHPTALKALKELQTHGIVTEISERSRGRVFLYDALIRILEEGAEPLKR